MSNNHHTRFFDEGYLSPIDILSRDKALSYRAELEALEKKLSGVHKGNKDQLNYPHLLFCFANEIARNEALLDVVESLLGRNILVWNSIFFIKEPHTSNYVSWHQDMRYWGLNDTDAVISAWVALSDVNIENGCMQFLPHTHKGAMLDHEDSFADDNILTRGQEVKPEYSPDDIFHVELEAGQASFHHGKLLHSSAPNHSPHRRIGFAIQYMAPHVVQELASVNLAMLVRGEDTHGNFELVEPPEYDLSPAAVALHQRALDTANEALYSGAAKTPDK